MSQKQISDDVKSDILTFNKGWAASVWRTLVGVRVQAAAELLAIDVYTRAEKSGVVITLALVERRLTELLAHRSGCAASGYSLSRGLAHPRNDLGFRDPAAKCHRCPIPNPAAHRARAPDGRPAIPNRGSRDGVR